ncbi:DUF7144 family membrane protein [Saccharopolyspora shandongensis]|uniref:DUF7144 family membrane protein n=1 Tax=Saccharopolyspora shandongensis TaxID=418495 RepID=UPI0033D72AAC
MSSPQTGPESQAKAEGTMPEQTAVPEQAAAPAEQKQWAMAPAQPTGAMSGWLAFAGSLIAMIGIFNIIGGITALFRPTYYLVGTAQLLVFDFAAWGWFWLALGVLQVAAGAGCLYGQMWARMTGIALAALSAIAHLAFFAAFPLWSLVVIALSVLVIYGLMVPPRGAAA